MNSKRLIILCLLIAALSLSAVSAADSSIDDTDEYLAGEVNPLTLQAADEDSGEELSADDSDVMADTATENTLETTNEDVLGNPDGNFSALQNLINTHTNYVELTDDYTYNDDDYTDGIIIDKDLTINGKGHYIDASNQASIFTLTDTCTRLILENITLKNAKDSAIYSENKISIELNDVNFIGNSAGEKGGAIAINSYSDEDITLSMTNVEFEDCTINYDDRYVYGGAIYINSYGNVDLIMSNVNFRDCSVISHSYEAYGGAIYVKSDNYEKHINIALLDVNFTNCIADPEGEEIPSKGGAIYLESSGDITLNMTTAQFKECKAYTETGDAEGGAIYISSQGNNVNINMDDVNFTDCSAYAQEGNAKGGAIIIYASNLINMNMTEVNFKDCTADPDEGEKTAQGGAIYIESNDLNMNMTKADFTNCNAYTQMGTAEGGAIYIQSYNINMNMTKADFTNCNAYTQQGNAKGGALYIQSYNINMNMTEVNFKDCTADPDEGEKTAQGGAIYLNSYECINLKMNKVDFTNCSAYTQQGNAKGGALYIESNDLNMNMTEVSFKDCIADPEEGEKTAQGGAIYIQSNGYTNNLNMSKVNFTNCNAYTKIGTAEGGAFYLSSYASNVNVNMDDVNFTNCNAYTPKGTANGGALYLDNIINTPYGSSVQSVLNVTMTNVEFTDCSADPDENEKNSQGGAIYLRYYIDSYNSDAQPFLNFEMTNTTFENCIANTTNGYGHGGAIYLWYYIFSMNSDMMEPIGNVAMTDVEFINCTAADYNGNYDAGGGAIYMYLTQYSLSAEVEGYLNLTMDNATFENCNAYSHSSVSGGAIYIQSEHFNINGNMSSVDFINCSAVSTADENNYDADGGAIYIDMKLVGSENVPDIDLNLTMSDVNFLNCNASASNGRSHGGAIRINYYGDSPYGKNYAHGLNFNLDMTNTEFNDCFVYAGADESQGGAIYFYSYTDKVIFNMNSDDVRFIDCSAISHADNALAEGGAIYIYNLWYTNNQEPYYNITFSDNKFINCTAQADGQQQASANGGAFYIYTLTSYYGGNNYVPIMNWIINDSEFTDCYANSSADGSTARGGGIYTLFDAYGNARWYVDLNITDSNFTNCNANASESQGGGIYSNLAEQSYNLRGNIDNAKFSKNHATEGGAIYSSTDSTYNSVLKIVNSEFLNNKVNSTDLIVTEEINRLNITLIGNENYFNALQILGEFEYKNITYYNGQITNTDKNNDTTDENESGQEIIVDFYQGTTLVNRIPLKTSASGTVSYDFRDDLPSGTYDYIAYHPDNSYYTYIEHRGILTVESSSTEVNLTVTVENIKYGQNATVQVTLKDINGNNLTNVTVNVTINGIAYEINITDGFGSRNISGLAAKLNYNATATFAGNASYKARNASTLFNVTQAPSMVNITPIVDVTYNATVHVVFNVTNATNVTYTVTYANGTPTGIENVKITDLQQDLILENLKAGNYTITIYNAENQNYTASNCTANFTVRKANSTLKANNITYTYGETGNTTIEYEGATKVDATVNEYPNASVTVGADMITVTGLPAGTYTLTITTQPDENHTAVSKTVNITVLKANSTLDVNNITFVYGGSNSTAVTYTGATGVNATVVDHPEAIIEIQTDKIIVSGLPVGTHTMNVTTKPDENHTAVSKTVTVTVTKAASLVEIEAIQTVTYETAVTVSFNVTNATKVTYNVTTRDGTTIIIHNKTVENVNATGNTITLTDLAAGNYTITIANDEDDTYTGDVKSADFTVNKAPSTLNVTDIEFYEGSSGSSPISYTGANNITCEVVNHPEASISVKDGAITVSNLPVGNYKLKVTTQPDENHTSITKEVNVTVKAKEDAEMNVTKDSPVEGENATVTVDLPEDAQGNVTVTLKNGTNYTAPVKNGKATVNVPNAPAGDNNVTVTYSGDDKYNGQSTNTVIHVKKILIDASDMKRGWDSPFDYQAKLIDEDGNPIEGKTISFTVGEKQYTATTDSNGVAKLTTSKLAVGEYTVTVTYPANGENTTAKTTIVARIIENKDLTKDFESSKHYTVRAIGDDGNPVGAGVIVEMKVNGKTYNIKTDKNGYATLQIHLNPKKYTITATYHKYTVKNKIKVKQTLKLVKKTVKVKKGKKIVLKAKLKWSSGKAIKGKVIKFKFRGKTYKAKTNKKGIAKVTIKNKKVLKKLKKGKKYAYSATYIKNIVKGKVKVKK